MMDLRENGRRWAMRVSTLAIGWLCLCAAVAAAAGAAEYVTTPDGRRVRLEFVEYGPVPVEKFTYYFDREGNRVMHGKHSRAFDDGRHLGFTHYLHGVMHGPFVALAADKSVWMQGRYERGLLHGTVLWFWPSGALRKKETYVHGQLQGPFWAYHENGQLKEEARFVAGLKSGPFAEYHPNGRVAFRGSYVGGYIGGRLIAFDANGVKVGEGMLDKEWIVGPWRCFAPDGTLERTRTDCQDRYYIECTCP